MARPLEISLGFGKMPELCLCTLPALGYLLEAGGSKLGVNEALLISSVCR
jgi:hypothetical protein